ncbi:MAG TPA: Gldg family protein [Phycisphaerales bacterium]|nr:Gldg family protein [Phycisphaerales bacterium]
MSNANTSSSAGGGGRSRVASWLNAAVLVLSFTACCALAVLVLSRPGFHTRLDVTATRQHDLSPRTRQVLERLDRDLHLVVAADLASLDRPTRQRTLDVVEQFSNASRRLRVTFIDTTEEEGQRSYELVLAELAQREKPAVDAAVSRVSAAAASAGELAADLDRVQRSMLASRERITDGDKLKGQYLATQSGVARVAMEDLRTAVANVRSHLASPDPLIPVPAIDRARAELARPVAAAAEVVNRLADDFDSLAKDPAATEADKAAAGAVNPLLRAARDRTGALSTELEALPVPRVLKVARALQLRRAALLIDENAQPGAGVGITAINTDELLASGGVGGAGGGGADRRARVEDLITGAVARLTTGIHPVVCIVHGAPRSLAAADWPMLQRVREQLSVRGIDLVEWPVAIEREIPARVAADSPSRPVVFVTITASGGNNPQAVAAGIAAYSGALNNLVASGRNVLLSVQVSQVPASGSPDPLTECLKPLGIEVDSGRPLLQSEKLGTRTVVVPRQDILEPGASHVLSGAVRDLRLRMQWPVAVSASAPGVHVRAEPVVTLPADGTRWAESEWQQFYNAVSQSKGDYRLIENPPMKDTSRDGAAPGAAWTVAMAVENAPPDRVRQRLVVVGANGWFLDDLVDLQAEVDGRVTALFPGNLQLLESSVHWLAGQDDQIVRGATVTSRAAIPSMSRSQQLWLRWLLIAIMPALALAAGAAYRALRP